MTLIVISGPPATGKTAIAKAIEESTGWPLIARDVIKEQLYDELGVKDREWSKKIGRQSYDIVEKQVSELFDKQQSFIIEGNFSGKTAIWIREQAKARGYDIKQIRCNAPDEEIMKRIKQRWESGERHRGHADDEFLQEVKDGHNWDVEREFSFGGAVLDLDEGKSLAENIQAALQFVK